MPQKNYTIELKVDFDGQEKHDIIINELKRQAKEILSVATLIADKRRPQVALHSNDMFVGSAEIEMFDPNENIITEET